MTLHRKLLHHLCPIFRQSGLWSRSSYRKCLVCPSHHRKWPCTDHGPSGWWWQRMKTTAAVLGWGLLSQFPQCRYYFFFSILKTHVSYWISPLYFTGVTAAELRWHLSNMNVIKIIYHVLLQDRKFCLRRNERIKLKYPHHVLKANGAWTPSLIPFEWYLTHIFETLFVIKAVDN